MNIFGNSVQNRPPVWLMRQAGRVLPNYRKLREKYSFRELMETPELAADVTLMPVDDIGVDAAIIFSDILTVPSALGMQIVWTDQGPKFPQPLCTVENPSVFLKIFPEKLEHVYKAIDIVVSKKNVPLIGFCGAPLTTLCYMIQGVSSKQNFPEAKKFFYQNSAETLKLIEIVTEVSIDYALKQVEHGINVFQIFESNAGLLPTDMYEEMFLPSIIKIANAVRSKNVPVIFFAKGLGCGLRMITPDVCDCAGIDWQTDIWDARKMVHPAVALQGNFDPHLLMAPQQTIEKKVEKYKSFFAENPNWICNLGHGVLADTPIENVKFFIDQIKQMHK
ncbi:MAG: uroporphyrinogen decarboxylase [Bacteroidales bacterium]|nr:uroporphyrinogen decarboxylase [Bacteroidales bacterium]